MTSLKSMADVVEEFDEIAGAIAADPRPDVFTRAELYLLSQVPTGARSALDVGCGDGKMSRALAARGIATLGIDASPGMIALARSRANSALLEFRVVDVTAESTPPSRYDVVISVSMAHHAPLERVLDYLRAAVSPGGTLLVQDVTTRRGLRHLPVNVLGWLARHLRLLAGAKHERPRVQALYGRHGRNEEYLDQSDVERVYRRLLAGARIHHHLGWRYTAIWHS